MSGGLRFIKMQGAGNDYVYVDCFSQQVLNPRDFSRSVSDRHFGVGSDGVILIRPSSRAHCFMDIYNADGSRGRTCGNGLRCTAMYLWEKNGEPRGDLHIETMSGISRARVRRLGKNRCWVTVTMGPAVIRPAAMPRSDVGLLLPEGLFVDQMHLVDTGNLHCVVLLKNLRDKALPETLLKTVDMKAVGGFLENYPGFPSGVNVEVCMAGGDCPPGRTVRARVWERGSGETMACGSGACAVYRAVGPGRPCCVFMPGGRLWVYGDEQKLCLGGEAVRVFEGTLPG